MFGCSTIEGIKYIRGMFDVLSVFYSLYPLFHIGVVYD